MKIGAKGIKNENNVSSDFLGQILDCFISSEISNFLQKLLLQELPLLSSRGHSEVQHDLWPPTASSHPGSTLCKQFKEKYKVLLINCLDNNWTMFTVFAFTYIDPSFLWLLDLFIKITFCLWYLLRTVLVLFV